MAQRNYNQKLYSGHAFPVLVDCKFTVNPTDTGGLGITSLAGPYVQAVYMNTSATPATLSPNPVAGNIVIQLQDNFSQIYSLTHAIHAPISGTPIVVTAAGAHLVAGTAYIISTIGTTTTAEWHSLGVPAGITPAVGTPFISGSLTGIGVGTGAVEIPAASSVASIEIVGTPTPMLNPTPSAYQGYGGSLILRCLDYAGALVAPTAGTVIRISVLLSNSSVTLQGD